MNFIKLDRYIFKSDDIGAVSYQQIFHNGNHCWHLIINYKDGNAIRIDCKTEEDCVSHFNHLADILQAQ